MQTFVSITGSLPSMPIDNGHDFNHDYQRLCLEVIGFGFAEQTREVSDLGNVSNFGSPNSLTHQQ